MKFLIRFISRTAAGGASRHGSATALPYDDGTFTHVVSQDALFLVPDKPRSHAEMFRVLAPGGVLAVSDFLQPTERIGEAARRHVYDRVRWNDGYSLDGYRLWLRSMAQPTSSGRATRSSTGPNCRAETDSE